MIHAKYKSTISNSYSLIQIADTTFQSSVLSSKFFLFGVLLLYCVCVVCYSLHEIFFYQDIIS